MVTPLCSSLELQHHDQDKWQQPLHEPAVELEHARKSGAIGEEEDGTCDLAECTATRTIRTAQGAAGTLKLPVTHKLFIKAGEPKTNSSENTPIRKLLCNGIKD